mmetsp:Transcript_11216/g.15736  ORF Transcript_11216/g.15736 Transcript_11216/m.15736 type:complete len:223 (-) Transcript_11216:530-1198(-)
MPVMPALTAIRHKPKEVKQHQQYQGHGLAASVRRMTRPPPCAGTARVGLEELLGSTSPSTIATEEAVAKARGSLTRGPSHFHAKATVPTPAVALGIRAARAIQGTAAQPPRTSSHSSPSTLLACLPRPHHRGRRFCLPQESLRTARRVQGLQDATVADFEARDSSRPTSPGPTQPSFAPMRGSPGGCSQALAQGWVASRLPVLQALARPSCEPLCWSQSGAW